jgi:high-affinity iron transporter
MHQKSVAGHWQRYLQNNLSGILQGRSAWLLAGLAFLMVYREVFETILFYAAIWAQGNGGAMLAGAAAAIAVLALVAVAMMYFSRRLPIGKFFAYSSWMIAVLAVVLIGKGTSALQEAGYIAINPLAGWPRSELLGVYPTQEGVIAQVAMAVLLIIGFAWNNRQAAKSA